MVFVVLLSCSLSSVHALPGSATPPAPPSSEAPHQAAPSSSPRIQDPLDQLDVTLAPVEAPPWNLVSAFALSNVVFPGAGHLLSGQTTPGAVFFAVESAMAGVWSASWLVLYTGFVTLAVDPRPSFSLQYIGANTALAAGGLLLVLLPVGAVFTRLVSTVDIAHRLTRAE